jgi:hypothetical protein
MEKREISKPTPLTGLLAVVGLILRDQVHAYTISRGTLAWCQTQHFGPTHPHDYVGVPGAELALKIIKCEYSHKSSSLK